MKYLTLIVVFTVLAPFFVYAGNLSGWAWSEIGWISMSCENQFVCAASPYGVDVSATGDLSGYAWSENIGWITFNPAEVGGCPSGQCSPTFNKTSGDINGWARVCAVFQTGCSGSLRSDLERGGWDGWIHLRDTSVNQWYGIFGSNGQLSSLRAQNFSCNFSDSFFAFTSVSAQ